MGRKNHGPWPPRPPQSPPPDRPKTPPNSYQNANAHPEPPRTPTGARHGSSAAEHQPENVDMLASSPGKQGPRQAERDGLAAPIPAANQGRCVPPPLRAGVPRSTHHTGTRHKDDGDFYPGEIIRSTYVVPHVGRLHDDDKHAQKLYVDGELAAHRQGRQAVQEAFYVRKRWFVVLCVFEECMLCLPLLTYSGEGLRDFSPEERTHFMAIYDEEGTVERINESPYEALIAENFAKHRENSYVKVNQVMVLEPANLVHERSGTKRGPGGLSSRGGLVQDSYARLVKVFDRLLDEALVKMMHVRGVASTHTLRPTPASAGSLLLTPGPSLEKADKSQEGDGGEDGEDGEDGSQEGDDDGDDDEADDGDDDADEDVDEDDDGGDDESDAEADDYLKIRAERYNR